MKSTGLDTVQDICKQLESTFSVFNIDKVWSNDGKKITIAFTAERLKKGYGWN